MALLGMLGPMPSGNRLDPDDNFFVQDHHNQVFNSGIHHGIPPHQNKFNIPNATISPDTIPNASFFQIPHKATEFIPGTTSTTTITSSSITAMNQPHYRQDSPASSQSSGSKRRTTHSTDQDEPDHGRDEVAIKRQRNTMAARKYRQKRLDRIADLERALAEMTGERDDLKLKLARREAEVEALREMLGR